MAVKVAVPSPLLVKTKSLVPFTSEYCANVRGAAIRLAAHIRKQLAAHNSGLWKLI